MRQLFLLVIDGTPRTDRRIAHHAATGASAAQVVLESLDRLCPQAVVTLLRACDGPEALQGLGDFDAILWTGTDLSLCESPHAPEVRFQVELMRACCEAGIPVFGSGWGLHLAVVAHGGEVTRNPVRREFPFARKIQKTQGGVTHPLLRGRPLAFDAISLHPDIIETLPHGSQILAHNRAGGIQAIELSFPQGHSFWGVQYIPEYDLRELAAYVTLHQDDLIDEGLFPDPGQAAAFSRRCVESHVTGRADLQIALGIDDDILADDIRQTELAAWLQRVCHGLEQS